MSTTSGSNPAFAYVLNNIITTNKSVKILSKAKKESINNELSAKQRRTNNASQEDEVLLVDEQGNQIISNEDAEKRTTKSKSNGQSHSSSSESSSKTKTKSTLNLKEVDKMCLVKPDTADREKEKRLQSIATRGVVQLFNVVKEKQQTLKHRLDEAGPSERKRVKILTEFEAEHNDLDDICMDKSETNSKKNGRMNSKKRGGSNKKWSVLDEDFMTRRSELKDWDKEEDDDD